jgi:hypothetical protein
LKSSLNLVDVLLSFDKTASAFDAGPAIVTAPFLLGSFGDVRAPIRATM